MDKLAETGTTGLQPQRRGLSLMFPGAASKHMDDLSGEAQSHQSSFRVALLCSQHILPIKTLSVNEMQGAELRWTIPNKKQLFSFNSLNLINTF